MVYFMENPTKIDDWEVPPFMEISICPPGNVTSIHGSSYPLVVVDSGWSSDNNGIVHLQPASTTWIWWNPLFPMEKLFFHHQTSGIYSTWFNHRFNEHTFGFNQLVVHPRYSTNKLGLQCDKPNQELHILGIIVCAVYSTQAISK